MLSQEIAHDVVEHLFSYVLVVLVIISALAVIYMTHLNRQTIATKEVLLSERDDLDVEYRNLVLEQNSLAETSEIEDKAAKLLMMQRPNTKSEVYVKLP